MKKFVILLTLTAVLCAEEVPAAAEETAPTAEPTGQAAVVATKEGQGSNWQNWVFVGGALVAAGIAVLVVALDSGSNAH